MSFTVFPNTWTMSLYFMKEMMKDEGTKIKMQYNYKGGILEASVISSETQISDYGMFIENGGMFICALPGCATCNCTLVKAEISAVEDSEWE